MEVRRMVSALPDRRPPSRNPRFYEGLYQALLRLGRELRLRDELVYCVSEGNLPNQGGKLVVHYLGRKRFADDFLMFYDRDAVDAGVRQNIAYTANIARFWRERQKAQVCPSDADVLLVDRIFEASDDATAVSLAPHINAVLPVQGSVEAQLGLIRSKGHRRKLQSALKKGFTWRKTHSLADFNLFYDVMYEPFVHDRFRYGASIVPRADMRRLFSRRGFLLFVEEDGKPISGAMMYTSRKERGTLYYWKYGLAYANTLTPNVFGERNAMTEAMVLQYAINEGFSEIDFGLTRALPWDGIFTHKKRLGCDFKVPPGTPEFRMMINPASQARLLSRFPLVVSQRGALQCLVAHEGELTPPGVEDFKESLRACAFPSLTAIHLYSQTLGGAPDLLRQAVDALQPDLGTRIALHS
jgi:hypothetical protein